MPPAIADAAEKLGSPLSNEFDRRLNVFVLVGADADEARAKGAAFLEAYHRRPMDESTIDRWLICGPADVCARRLSEYVAAGIRSFQCVLASVHQETQMDRIAAEVIPALLNL